MQNSIYKKKAKDEECGQNIKQEHNIVVHFKKMDVNFISYRVGMDQKQGSR